ncbi:MAG: trehalose synthase [Acidimicrobiia bacterium]|nr:trehalose synthase [Acidimicrobiia bacterium]
MSDRWYKEAVIYCLDVDTFQDSNGDGFGDIPGLISRLDYLDRLGITCLWLNPIHPTPNRDDGYDVTDYYGIDPRIGTLGDFAELLHQANNRGLRVIIDLVVNHTSDQHPWFLSARADPKSPYRDWYVWSKEEPTDRRQGMVFPGQQKETWTFDDAAQAWYYHRFYNFQPDLNMANPEVRAEIHRVVSFWVQLGVSGFRMDAAPFVIEQTRPNEPNPPMDFGILDALYDTMSWRRAEPLMLAEANVEKEQLVEYFGDGRRLPMMFNFLLNQRTFLALARGDATPIVSALEAAPALPPSCQFATFLRNHDEVDLGRLGDREREEVFAAFGPDANMQLYDRGIRRRLAPMLGNDQARLRMAYALQFTLPGTPVLRYGDEIGMGENLALPERAAIRTPMQWTHQENAAFSTAPAKKLCQPVISGGEFGHEVVNVLAQRKDPHSLLAWMERMIRTLRECPEFGAGRCESIDIGERSVLCLRAVGPTGAMLALTNLGPKRRVVDAGPASTGYAVEIFSDRSYGDPDPSLAALELAAYGYRWIRIGWSIPSGPPSAAPV